jgi:hypothetical protein
MSDELPDFITIRSARHDAMWECSKCRPVPSTAHGGSDATRAARSGAREHVKINHPEEN